MTDAQMYPQFATDALKVIDTETRKMSPAAAKQIVFNISRKLLELGVIPFYKKIDSTLKGNWCNELDALFHAVAPELVIIAPAFPTWHRTTENGIQRYKGNRASKARNSSVHRDEPPLGSDPDNIVQTLESHFGRRVKLIRRAILHRGPESVEVEIERNRFLGFPFLVFDATEDEDLRLITLGGCRVERKILWVGSAGLARFLPLGWGRQTNPFHRHIKLSRRVLIINGSLNPVNIEQFNVLSEMKGIPTSWITEDDRSSDTGTLQRIDLLLARIQEGKDAAISVRLSRSANSSNQIQLLQETLRFAVDRCFRSGLEEDLILVGGDTAIEVYRKNEAKAIRILGEIEPGIPFGQWIGGHLSGQSLVTKAGGFGTRTTLLGAVEFLHGDNNTGHSYVVP